MSSSASTTATSSSSSSVESLPAVTAKEAAFDRWLREGDDDLVCTICKECFSPRFGTVERHMRRHKVEPQAFFDLFLWAQIEERERKAKQLQDAK